MEYYIKNNLQNVGVIHHGSTRVRACGARPFGVRQMNTAPCSSSTGTSVAEPVAFTVVYFCFFSSQPVTNPPETDSVFHGSTFQLYCHAVHTGRTYPPSAASRRRRCPSRGGVSPVSLGERIPRAQRVAEGDALAGVASRPFHWENGRPARSRRRRHSLPRPSPRWWRPPCLPWR